MKIVILVTIVNRRLAWIVNPILKPNLEIEIFSIEIFVIFVNSRENKLMSNSNFDVFLEIYNTTSNLDILCFKVVNFACYGCYHSCFSPISKIDGKNEIIFFLEVCPCNSINLLYNSFCAFLLFHPPSLSIIFSPLFPLFVY